MKRRFLLAALPALLLSSAQAAEPLNLGTRWELFVDEFLVAQKQGAALRLHTPVKREVVLTTNQPWEGVTCAYFSVIQHKDRVLMYYRGSSGGSGAAGRSGGRRAQSLRVDFRGGSSRAGFRRAGSRDRRCAAPGSRLHRSSSGP